MFHESICDIIARAGESPESAGATVNGPALICTGWRDRSRRTSFVLHRQVLDAPFYRLLDYLVQGRFTGGNVVWGIRSLHVLGPGADWTRRTLA